MEAKDYVTTAKDHRNHYHTLYILSGSGLSFEDYVSLIAGQEEYKLEEALRLNEIYIKRISEWKELCKTFKAKINLLEGSK